MSSEMPPTQKPSWLLISDKVYNTLKFLSLILLPASGALYFGLAQIWHFPNGEQVVGTISLITVFLGTGLGISTAQYNKSGARYDGALVVDTTDATKDVYTFEVQTPIEQLRSKKSLTIKVHNPE